MNNSPKVLWDQCLQLIKQNVTEQQYDTWFKPIRLEKYIVAEKRVVIQVKSTYMYEYLEGHYLELFKKVLGHYFGAGVKLSYKVAVVQGKGDSGKIEILGEEADTDIEPAETKMTNQSPSVLDEARPQQIDSQLNPHLTFNNYIEGESNKLPRSIGLTVAEHPKSTQFNPMFIYGPSGCGKTHLINAIGMKAREMNPNCRVLYVSARLFQVQYTNSVRNNTTNDFIGFYQTIDVLIVDDIQEWVTAPGTQMTFFHIFNHLFRNSKRIILASDRPPVDLKGMSDRLLTRFSCGLIAELEKPNTKLCVDILNNKIKRDGLKIPTEVIDYIAKTACGSVRDLQGVINSLLAYAVVYNCNLDLRLAERVIKRAVKVDDRPLTIDDILDTVCNHFGVSSSAISSRSRKREFVVARQVSMYLAQKYTKMPASRIGKLVGGRDHSTVLHSCSQVERRIKTDRDFQDELTSIENAFKLKQ